ncbi:MULTISPECIES: hypothetical protein [Pseudomonas]|uniref:hypothetical protein n=1 Tax=Pseudomonas TaxID=286 RepID=UPI001010C0A9|nr:MULTISPECIES: hypothetical protein [Pseudomonas]NAP07019.1 hypothetical protein [Pseudomonas syringae]NAP27548.1 hypothetical protein [Pseudomonas syringae]NAP49903.1 hypothetical protein [Pseudomonas syringae]NAP86170.1 hypothetical protein [Pseudomonas syringae]
MPFDELEITCTIGKSLALGNEVGGSLFIVAPATTAYTVDQSRAGNLRLFALDSQACQQWIKGSGFFALGSIRFYSVWRGLKAIVGKRYSGISSLLSGTGVSGSLPKSASNRRKLAMLSLLGLRKGKLLQTLN